MHNGTKLKIMLKVNFLRGLNLYSRKCKQLDECQIYFLSLFIFSTGKQREHNNPMIVLKYLYLVVLPVL